MFQRGIKMQARVFTHTKSIARRNVIDDIPSVIQVGIGCILSDALRYSMSDPFGQTETPSDGRITQTIEVCQTPLPGI